MDRSLCRRVALALVALLGLQLGAALANAAPCATACCPEMAAGSPSGGVDEAPCRSLTPVSCCGQGTSAPAPAASAPPVAAPAAVALAALPYALPAQAAPVPRDERATPSPALRSVVLRL